PAGTTMVADVNPGAAGSTPQQFAAVNSHVVFFATGSSDSGIYVTDGTAGGTRFLHPFAVISDFTAFDNALYFLGRGASTQYQLWKTDGTPAGTTLVSDVNGSSGALEISNQYAGSGLVVFNGGLFFAV